MKKETIIKGDQIDSIIEVLIKKGKVKATRLGKFKITNVKGKFYDIVQKKTVHRNYKKVSFTATKRLKESINK